MGAGLLLVEDDDGIAAPLARALGREGYDVTRVATGQDALDFATGAERPHLMILDLGLPDIDGLDVCSRARANGFDGAILILTARGEELDRVIGLDSGADDYMAKPVALAELLARVRALLRRFGSVASPAAAPAASARPASPPSADGAFRIDSGARRVWVRNREVQLSAKE